MLKRLVSLASVMTATALVASPALAQSAVNYSGITSAVDFDDVILAMVAVGGIVAFVLVARKGIRFLLGALR